MKRRCYTGLLLFLTLFLLTNFSGCKPDDDINWTRHEYMNDYSRYLLFDQGTTWVYERSTDQVLDTIRVTKVERDTAIISGGGNTLHYEYGSWEAISNRDNYHYKLHRYLPLPKLESGILSATDTIFSRYYLEKSKDGDYAGLSCTFIYPLTKTELSTGDLYKTLYIETLDTLTISKIEYREVIVFEVTNDATFTYDEGNFLSGGRVRYYYAPDIGIVRRKHMTENVTWDLIYSK